VRVLVTGGHGVFGNALRDAWKAREAFADAQLVRVGRASCDVTNDAAVTHAFRVMAPDIVIHAAAVTDHGCRDAVRLIATNIVATARVARHCRAWGARLVYLSTHYVYGGEAPDGGYAEDAALAPVGAYAWSKLAGEHAALEACHDALVVRGSWYDYASRIKHWLNAGAIADAWGSRMRVADAARVVAELAEGGARGVYNIGAQRRSFLDICHDEGYSAAEGISRLVVNRRLNLDYPFPRDTSVSLRKLDAWRADRAR
jgi:dTDP-4-dehydrorhamnose reductase